MECIYDSGIVDITNETDEIKCITCYSDELIGYKSLTIAHNELFEQADKYLNDDLFDIIYNNLNLSYEDLRLLISKDISDEQFSNFCVFLDDWIKKVRNDHLHEDLVFNKREANEIIEKTYEIISQICLLIK